MPHVLVEYSSNLEDAVSIRELIDDLHITMIESGLFDLSAIRTRALPRSIYRIADGKPENVFLHIVTRIRSGRSVEERKTARERAARHGEEGARQRFQTDRARRRGS